MTKLAFPLSLAALAGLGACATYEPATPAPVVVTQPAPVVTAPAGTVVVPPVVQAPQVAVPQTIALRPGTGRIESISAIPSMGSASAGASSANRRLAVKMDDGTLQYVDTDARNLAIGDRVQFTADGYIKHPVP